MSKVLACAIVKSSGDPEPAVALPLKVAVDTFDKLVLVITPDAIVVALPTDVTGPVKFALVVTVPALPVMFI